MKVYEPVLVAGEEAFSAIDIRLRVKGGGHTSQVYALRQAIAKALVAYYAKYMDAYSAMELKKKLVAYDRTLLIADPRRCEPKKFGGHGARARRQKSCVPMTWFPFFLADPTPQLPVNGYIGCQFALHCHVSRRLYLYAMAICNSVSWVRMGHHARHLRQTSTGNNCSMCSPRP